MVGLKKTVLLLGLFLSVACMFVNAGEGTYTLSIGDSVQSDSGYKFTLLDISAFGFGSESQLVAAFQVESVSFNETIYLKQGESFKNREVELAVEGLNENFALVTVHSFAPFYAGPAAGDSEYLVKGEGGQDKEPDPILFIAAAILIAALLAFYADYSRRRGRWRAHERSER